jgi:hypothetical protein
MCQILTYTPEKEEPEYLAAKGEMKSTKQKVLEESSSEYSMEDSSDMELEYETNSTNTFPGQNERRYS